MKNQKTYSIVQFLSDPDRQESMNVGVVLFDEARGRVLSRFIEDFSRISRLYSEINKNFLRYALAETERRLQYEFSRSPSSFDLERFRSMRSNNIRLTQILPTFAEDSVEEVDRLFDDLVGQPEKKPRRTKVGVTLKKNLKEMGLLKYFDSRPESITLPRYGVRIQPDLAIRRDRYHLLEASRFDSRDGALEILGRHVLEGRALYSNLRMQLVVVGDFSGQTEDFFSTVKEDLQIANTKLFRLDRLDQLAHEYVLH